MQVMCNACCEVSLIGNLVSVNLSINVGNTLFICALCRSYIRIVTRRYSEYFEKRLLPYRSRRGMVKGWDKLK